MGIPMAVLITMLLSMLLKPLKPMSLSIIKMAILLQDRGHGTRHGWAGDVIKPLLRLFALFSSFFSLDVLSVVPYLIRFVCP